MTTTSRRARLELAHVLAGLRRGYSVSVQQMADRINVKPEMIQAVDEAQPVNVNVLHDYAEALGLTVTVVNRDHQWAKRKGQKETPPNPVNGLDGAA